MSEKDTLKGVHDGHRKRLRAEIRQSGITSATPDHKILELLLFYALPRKDTNEIAHLLLNRFGSLAGVLNASYAELLTVDGINESSATFLSVLVPIFQRYSANNGTVSESKHISGADDGAQYIYDRFKNGVEEQLKVLCMDANGKITHFDTVAKGNFNSTEFCISAIVEYALKNAAASIIIAHNHPSGIAAPSKNDLFTTVQVSQALKYVGIKLADHVIIGQNGFASMANSPYYRDIFKEKQ
ncbi:MAG: hypothetical protein KBS41_01750 [Oscillospiraceae bacterium]|nr:hypothetical protein [Candidatus Equicaccousia limihippi]